MKPPICPNCGTPQQWELWSHCACGYDFGPPPAHEPNRANSDGGTENGSSQDHTGKRLRYGVLFRRVCLGFVAFYGIVGLVYGMLVTKRGLPPGEEVKLPLGSGSISATGWTNVEGASGEEKTMQGEPDPFVGGVICALMIAFSGLLKGVWFGMLAVLALWFWRMFSSREVKQT